MVDELQVLALWDKPLSALGLAPATVELLEAESIATVGDLMDSEWARFPTAVADEIRQAAIEVGLLESDAPVSSAPTLNPEELEERAWLAVGARFADQHELTISAFERVEDPGVWNRIGASRRWRELRSLSILNHRYPQPKHWYELLEQSPPGKLQLLSLGAEWSGWPAIGPAHRAIEASKSLTTLDLRGELGELSPMWLSQLQHLTLRTRCLPQGSFFKRCKFPKLETLQLVAEEGDAQALLPLLRTSTLQRLDVRGLHLDLAWFEQLLQRERPLKALSVACELGESFEDESKIFALIGAKMSGCTLALPGSARESAGELLAGLDVEWSDFG